MNASAASSPIPLLAVPSSPTCALRIFKGRTAGLRAPLERLGAVLLRRAPPAPGDEDDAIAVRLFGIVDVHQQSEPGIHPEQNVRLDAGRPLAILAEKQGAGADEGSKHFSHA